MERQHNAKSIMLEISPAAVQSLQDVLEGGAVDYEAVSVSASLIKRQHFITLSTRSERKPTRSHNLQAAPVGWDFLPV